jgi:hypothetical protein
MVPCFNIMNNFTTSKRGVGALPLLVSALKKPPVSKLDLGCLYFKTIQFFAVPLQSSSISQCPAQVTVQPSPEYQAAAVKQQTANIPELCRGLSSVLNLLLCHFSQRFI